MPRYTDERLSRIYDKTSGKCHICHRKLSWSNYGVHGARGAWHVDHSKARARGGSDHGNNLYPACISCNLEKSTATTRTARGWHGHTSAPLLRDRAQAKRSNNMWGSAAVGAGIGLRVAGPAGALVGGLLGAVLGDTISAQD